MADLYLAHRVGLRFALEILNSARFEPRARAALVLPDLDEIAPSLVFMGDRATSFSEIVAAVGQAVARAQRLRCATPAAAPWAQPPGYAARRSGTDVSGIAGGRKV